MYKNLEERANANASKAIAKLQEDTYYYQLDKKLFRSNDDYSKTGYDYNNTVGSFSIVAGDGVQEIKLDNNMFRPTEKVATPTDASSEVSTEATTEPDTQVATTSDASSEETETTIQIATPTDSIPEVEPVVTLASIFRAAGADVYVWGTESQGCGNYHKTSSSANSANLSLDGDIGSRMFCVDWGANGPSLANGYTKPVKYSRGDGAKVSLRKVVAYYYEVLAKTSGNLAATEHYLSLLNGKKGTTPTWASEAMKYTALASGEETISIDKTKPSMTYYKSYSFKANGEVFHTSTNVFVSEPVTVTAEKSEQYFTASVPKDCAVYVYNYNSETKKYQWTRYGSTDNLKLKNGDKFRIVLPKSFANKTVSLSGTARYVGWDVYYYNPNDPAWLDCQQMVLATETDKPEFSLSVKTGDVPPDYDPVNLYIRKIDSVSGKAVPAGASSLAGAVFKMEYFKGKDSASGSATNTWYLRTVKNSSDGITKLHVGYASKTAIFRDSVDYYNLIVGDWYSTTLTLHLNKDGKDAGPLKDANGNLITATVKFQAKTTDGSVKVEVKYDASLLAGETVTAFETIRTKDYEVCAHADITDKGQSVHYPELKTSAKNSKDNSQHVKEGEVAKIVDTVNYSKLDSSVAYKVVTEAWDYNTQQIVVSDGKKVRKVTELHVDSKKPENGSFDVSMSFKTDGLGKHRIVIFEYVYDNKGNLISKEADFDAESQTIYIDKTPNKTGDRTVMFLSILAGMLGLGVVTLFVTRRKKK